MRLGRTALPVLLAGVVLTVYLRTLLPGLGGGGDAVKFQYLGSVLGTAHPPGYPLFVCVSFLFSRLPLGSMAHRMNVMSAVFGVLTAVVAWAVLRRQRVAPAVAGIAAVSLAFGRTFWGKSLAAEVYSFNALLIMLIVCQAVRWADSGRRRDLYATAALLGLSLGNHLTAAMLAPALVVFVAATRPSEVRVRPALVCIGLGALGLTQYLFILVRTWQQAPYAEARASTLPELVHVVLASKYADEMFVFSARQLLTERLPHMARAFSAELGFGTGFFCAGLVWGLWTRSTRVLLFVAALVCIAALTLNIDADVDGFLLPAYAMAWLVAGLGMQLVYGWASRAGRLAAAGSAIVLAMVPVALVSGNYRANDHHRRTYETRYMDALFRQLDGPTAFVREQYATDQLVLYKVAGEHANGGRRVELIEPTIDDVQRHAREHATIYAYEHGRSTLEGFGLRFSEVHLHEWTAAGPDPNKPIDMTPLRLFRLKAWTPCASIGNLGWQDVTPAAIGGPLVVRLDNYRAFDARVTVYAADDSPAEPMMATIAGPAPSQTTAATFGVAAGERPRLQRALVQDEVAAPLQALVAAGAYVHRFDMTVNDQGQFSQSVVGFGPHVTRVVAQARLDLDGARRGVVCGWADRTLFSSARRETLTMETDDAGLFGPGWMPAGEVDGGGRGRWIESASAGLAIVSAVNGGVRVQIRASPSDDDHGHTLGITVNGRGFAPQPMPNEWSTFEWHVPADVFRRGLNRVTVDVGGRRDPGEHPAVVSAIALDLEDAAR